MTTLNQVQRTIKDHLGLEDSDVLPTVRVDDLPKDSLDDVELVMALEEEFGITIEDDEAEKLNTMTVSEVAAWVDSKQS